MTLLLQVSDPHFGTERAEVVEALVALAAHKRPEVLVLSGDITQRARRAQFDAAVRLCHRLSIPHRLVLPGNHDIPLFDLATRIFDPYRLFRRAFGDELEPVLDLPDLLVVGVNTTRAHRHKHGEISAAQVDRVAQRLWRAHSGQLRVVVTHQPMDVPYTHELVNMARGSEDAVRTWVAAGADVVMGGHIHLPFIRPLSERYAGLPRRSWCVQAGTAVSHRVREGMPNSVNLVEHFGSGFVNLERWDYGDEGGFHLGERVEIGLDRGTG